jgi:hypothetical protein
MRLRKNSKSNVVRRCLGCRKVLPPQRIATCSNRCRCAAMKLIVRRGANHYKWRGGISEQWRKTRAKIHDLVNHAIRRGDLTRLPCDECGHTIRVNAHHEDYSKPFDIWWLCVRCHKKLHENEDKIYA